MSSAAVKSAAASRWWRVSGRESTTRRDRCLNREEPRGAEGSRGEPRGAERSRVLTGDRRSRLHTAL